MAGERRRRSSGRKKAPMASTEQIWKIRRKDFEIDANEIYAQGSPWFTLKVHHGGVFKRTPATVYKGGTTDYVDMLHAEEMSVHELDKIIMELGYQSPLFYHFMVPATDLDIGLRPLACDQDILYCMEYVSQHKEIWMYVEHGISTVGTYSLSPFKAKDSVMLEELPCDVLMLSPRHNRSLKKSNSGSTSAKKLFVEEPNLNKDEFPPYVVLDDNEVNDVDYVSKPGYPADEAEEHQQPNRQTEDDEDDSDDSDYEPTFQDEENEIMQVEVDMKEFRCNVDPNVEWAGSTFKTVLGESGNTDEDTTEALNFDEIQSGSGSDNDETEGRSGRSKRRKKTQFPQYDRTRDVSNPVFYIGQEFGSPKDVKEAVKVHAIQTRRDLYIKKNDSVRVRAIYRGTYPKPQEDSEDNDGDNVDSPTKEVQTEFLPCPWVLLVSRQDSSTTWAVKTYKSEHLCLQTRDVGACTATYLAKEIVEDLKSNPTIPVNAIQNRMQKKLEVNVSFTKAFRAKVKAHNALIGDYTRQYSLLRNYILELQRSNPGTSVTLDVEPSPNPHEPTRTFRRLYVCLGPLKEGFRSMGREMLGLDGAFMKGPYPGQLLSAVGVDCNNGIYPLAYALVEAETFRSWVWFLECLGNDLGLQTDSAFTFISDRQKGLIPALAKVFPNAEHRFCLQHIYQNFKKEGFRGKAFKDSMWKAATATTVMQYESAMEEIKQMDKKSYDWVNAIGPHHWSRSHMSGRARSDCLFNNMCESLNKELVPARDKPIVTCLEYVREYLMKHIVVVQTFQSKCNGPLCPKIAQIFNNTKAQTAKYDVLWNGGEEYQVSGPSNDQCVVNLKHKKCSCRKWELTFLPCKHAVAAIWNLGVNGGDGLPENWVDPVYKLDTWRKMYSFKIKPINGPNMWPISLCPTEVKPPLHHVQPGRPKKGRRKDPEENQSQSHNTQGSKLSRSHTRLTCSKCKNPGHNARTCKGQGGATGSQPAGTQTGNGESSRGTPSQANRKKAPQYTQNSRATKSASSQAAGTQASASHPAGNSQVHVSQGRAGSTNVSQAGDVQSALLNIVGEQGRGTRPEGSRVIGARQGAGVTMIRGLLFNTRPK